MVIRNLKDIKDALNEVPDELLDGLHFGTGEGCEADISMIASEGTGEYDFPQVFDLVDKKYPKLNEVNKLIQNVAKVQVILDDDGKKAEKIQETLDNEGISSDFFERMKERV